MSIQEIKQKLNDIGGSVNASPETLRDAIFDLSWIIMMLVHKLENMEKKP